MRPDGADPQPFPKRDPALTPIEAVLIANAGEFEFPLGTVRVDRAERIDDEEDGPRRWGRRGNDERRGCLPKNGGSPAACTLAAAGVRPAARE